MKICPRLIGLIFVAVLCASGVWAQKKPRTAPKTPAARPAKKLDPRTAAATRVAEQIKTLSKFIYLFGGISKDLAAADEAIKNGDAEPETAQQLRQHKAALISSLRNVQDGLDKLEADFRFTPPLQQYYDKLKGVATNAALAEEKCANGQYDEAGRALLAVVNQLTDVLLEMR